MNSDFEPLAYKVAEAVRKRSVIRGHAHDKGVHVEVDADGRLTALTLDDEARYLGPTKLAAVIIEQCREAERSAQPAIEEVMRAVKNDPMSRRVATFTGTAIRPTGSLERPLSDDELEARQTARITRQLRNR